MTSNVASAIRPGLRDTRAPPGSPHTPSRYVSSVQSSPGSSFLRQEEDPVIVELDVRRLQAGFQGESGPQCTIAFSPQNSRRVGDYRPYLPDYKRRREEIATRCKDYELFRNSLVDVDLGLLQDKLERAVREAYNKHLLVDAGSARLVLVLPSLVPHPVLSTILTLLFERWKYSTITLVPAPTMTVVAAGLRSGLVINVGWEETVITAVYEYREVQARRTTRAMKLLTGRIADLLDAVRNEQPAAVRDSLLFDFDWVEEFIARVGACHALVRREPTVAVQLDAMALDVGHENGPQPPPLVIDWPTHSSLHSVSIPQATLHQTCRDVLVGSRGEESADDHEHSISHLLYRVLLTLSADVRSVCMPRIVFCGQGSSIAGLSRAVFDTTSAVISQFGWTPVRGRHLKAKRHGLAELVQVRAAPVDAQHHNTPPKQGDFVEEGLFKQKSKDALPLVPAALREVQSLGPWAGASLMGSLKAKSAVEIEREKFLAHGLAGAQRELDPGVPPTRPAASKGVEKSTWTLAGWG